MECVDLLNKSNDDGGGGVWILSMTEVGWINQTDYLTS